MTDPYLIKNNDLLTYLGEETISDTQLRDNLNLLLRERKRSIGRFGDKEINITCKFCQDEEEKGQWKLLESFIYAF